MMLRYVTIYHTSYLSYLVLTPYFSFSISLCFFIWLSILLGMCVSLFACHTAILLYYVCVLLCLRVSVYYVCVGGESVRVSEERSQSSYRNQQTRRCVIEQTMAGTH